MENPSPRRQGWCLKMPTRYRRVFLHFDEEKDADVIAYLDAQSNKTDAVRRALRRQINKEAEDAK